MAASINRVILVGNLTRDPELKTLPSGTPVCSLGIAVNHRRKNQQTGEWTEEPNYFNVEVSAPQGENCARYLAKGRAVGGRRPPALAAVGGAGRQQALGGGHHRRDHPVPPMLPGAMCWSMRLLTTSARIAVIVAEMSVASSSSLRCW